VSTSRPGLGSTGTRAPVVRGQRQWLERTALSNNSGRTLSSGAAITEKNIM
jgi:hypothetical protein